METLHFSEQWLINKLDRLPPPLRVLFACATAAERLLPAYLRLFASYLVSGDPSSIKCSAFPIVYGVISKDSAWIASKCKRVWNW